MSNQAINDNADMTFGEHLDELRKILFRVIAVFVLLAIVMFSIKGIVLDIVFAPIRESFPTNRFFAWLAEVLNSEGLNIHPENIELYNNKMAGQFLLHIKSSVIGAFIVAFPYLIWELWLFVKPAIPEHQRRRSFRYVIETPIWFLMGLLFGYYIIAPLAINFLGNYQVSDQINNIIEVSSFMGTVMSVSFAAAIAFQLPLLIRLLANMGLMTAEGMRKYRKIAVVVLLIFAAIITPPDVISQVLIFIPCYALYEYGITIAARIEVQKAKEEAEYQAKMQQTAAEQGVEESAETDADDNAEQGVEAVVEDNAEKSAEEGADESIEEGDEESIEEGIEEKAVDADGVKTTEE